MGQAKIRRLSIKDCYLCGKPLEEPTSVDHVPPKLFFPDEIRKKYKTTELLTIRVHHACNQEWRMDEEYFVQTLIPLAGGSESADAARRQSLRKYMHGKNVPLVTQVMKEFRREIGGVHLPANKVAKLIDTNRAYRVIWKLVRGLHFHHTGEILPIDWDMSCTITAPNQEPPEYVVPFLQSVESRGRYQAVFAYAFKKFPEVHDLHIWAFLLWDCIIVTAAFHDMACGCEGCVFIGPTIPE
jgi:hypothetical protein